MNASISTEYFPSCSPWHAIAQRLLIPLLLVTATPSSRAQISPLIRQDWALSSYGWYAGASGLSLLHTSSGQEIALSASSLDASPNDYWYTLRYDSTRGVYRQTWVSTLYNASIRSLRIADLDQDGREEVVLLLGDGQVLILDAETKTTLRQFSSFVPNPRSLAIADGDGDGALELTVCGLDRFAQLSTTGSFLWGRRAGLGTEVEIGQLDSDSGLELVCSNGAVFDIASRTQQCNTGKTYLSFELADVNGDHDAEIVGFTELWDLEFYDVGSCTVLRSAFAGGNEGIFVRDLDGNGTLELLITDQFALKILDLVSQTLLVRLSLLTVTVSSALAADLDGDGARELFFGAGRAGGKPLLNVWNFASQSYEWQGEEAYGPFHGPVEADVDGDGIPELAVTCFRSASSVWSSLGGLLFLLDSRTGEEKARTRQIEIRGSNCQVLCPPLPIDHDADGDAELVVAGGGGEALIALYDYEAPAGWRQIWVGSPTLPDHKIVDLALADVTGDGIPEVIAAAATENSADPRPYLMAFRASDGARLWLSNPLDPRWISPIGLAVGNFDEDPSEEIAVVLERSSVLVIDTISLQVQTTIPGSHTAVAAFDPGMGAPDFLLVGDDGGRLLAHVIRGGQVVATGIMPTGLGRVEGMTVLPNFLSFLQSGNTLYLFHPYSLPLPLWSTRAYGSAFGRKVYYDLRNGTFATSGSYCVAGFSVR
jgi:hypothetical protein